MVAKPDLYPDFANLDITNPISGNSNTAEPESDEKQEGFTLNEKPRRRVVNFLFRYINRWIKWFEQTAEIDIPANITNEYLNSKKVVIGEYLLNEPRVIAATTENGITNSPSNTIGQFDGIGDITWASQYNLYASAGYLSGGFSISTSPDGKVWTGRSNINGVWTSICNAPEINKIVAVGTSGSDRAIYSTNGTTWTAAVMPEANAYYSVAWSPTLNLFAAVSTNGTNRVATSPDGVTWTARSCPSRLWRGIVWAAGLGLFVAVADNSGNPDVIMTSADGINWGITYSNVTNLFWTSIAWSEELGVLVTGTEGFQYLGYSEDGSNWQIIDITSLSINGLGKIIWVPEWSMFVGALQVCAASSDGLIWRKMIKPQGVTCGGRGLAWSPDLFRLINYGQFSRPFITL